MLDEIASKSYSHPPIDRWLSAIDRYEEVLDAFFSSNIGQSTSDPGGWYRSATADNLARVRAMKRSFVLWYERHVQAALEAGEPDLATRVYLRRLELEHRERFSARDAAALAARGLEEIGESEEVVLAYLLATYAEVHYPARAPDPDAALRFVDMARGAAKRFGAPGLVAEVEVAEAMYLVHRGEVRRALAHVSVERPGDPGSGWECSRYPLTRGGRDALNYYPPSHSLEEARDRLALAMIGLRHAGDRERLLVFLGALLHFEGGARPDTVEAFDAVVQELLQRPVDPDHPYVGWDVVGEIDAYPLAAARLAGMTDWAAQHPDAPRAKPAGPPPSAPTPHQPSGNLVVDVGPVYNKVADRLRQGSTRKLVAAFEKALGDGLRDRGADTAALDARATERAREEEAGRGAPSPEEDARVRREVLRAAEARFEALSGEEARAIAALDAARFADWARDAEKLLHYATIASANRDPARANLAGRYRGGALLALRRWEEAFAILDQVLPHRVPTSTWAWAMMRGHVHYPDTRSERMILQARRVALWARPDVTEWAGALGALAEVFREDDGGALLLARFAAAVEIAEDPYTVIEQLEQRSCDWAAARARAWEETS